MSVGPTWSKGLIGVSDGSRKLRISVSAVTMLKSSRATQISNDSLVCVYMVAKDQPDLVASSQRGDQNCRLISKCISYREGKLGLFGCQHSFSSIHHL
jgi:hypothetical protein